MRLNVVENMLHVQVVLQNKVLSANLNDFDRYAPVIGKLIKGLNESVQSF